MNTIGSAALSRSSRTKSPPQTRESSSAQITPMNFERLTLLAKAPASGSSSRRGDGIAAKAGFCGSDVGCCTARGLRPASCLILDKREDDTCENPQENSPKGSLTDSLRQEANRRDAVKNGNAQIHGFVLSSAIGILIRLVLTHSASAPPVSALPDRRPDNSPMA